MACIRFEKATGTMQRRALVRCVLSAVYPVASMSRSCSCRCSNAGWGPAAAALRKGVRRSASVRWVGSGPTPLCKACRCSQSAKPRCAPNDRERDAAASAMMY